jgi:hypothetical protein
MEDSTACTGGQCTKGRWSLRTFKSRRPKPGFILAIIAAAVLPAKENALMKRILVPALILVASCALQAKDKPAYQDGVLLQMDSAACGSEEKGGSTVNGEILGTDGEHKKTQELLCQEYTLQTDRLIYRIRAKSEKHPALLPIGETAQFRLHKGELLLRLPEGDGKEHQYVVVSMTPRSDAPVPINQSASAVHPTL